MSSVMRFDEWQDSEGNLRNSVLQVVSTTKTDTFTTTSASFVDVTGLSVSVTPTSTSSKILVICQVAYGLTGGTSGHGHFKLSGGNTNSYVGDAASTRISAIFGGYNPSDMSSALLSGSIVYLDSPATTSSVTYGVQARQALNSAASVNRSGSDNDDAANTRGASTITVMEIAG